MLLGKKIKLYRITKNNVPTLYNWHEKESLFVFRRFGELATIEELLKKYNKVPYGEFNFIVELNSTGPVGTCSYWNINWKNRTCSIFIQIFNDNIERSIFKETLITLISFLFFDMGLQTIQKVVNGNKLGIAVLESIGFKLEGKLVEHYYHGGAFRDSHILSLRKIEFRG